MWTWSSAPLRWLAAIVVLGVLAVGFVLLRPTDDVVPTPDAAAEPDRAAPAPPRITPAVEHPFDRSTHSTKDPSSIWVIVNKSHAIRPLDFRPEISIVQGYQVASPAATPLRQLLAAADRAALGLKIASAFRSYDYQVATYGGVVAARGQAAADRVSARPGHSEHQTGLAVDLVTPDDPGCDFEACFAHTRAGRWLADRAWRFGFVVRYQPGETAVTGYAPEPWHLRYVGRPLAAELHRDGDPSLEEFFGISGGDYRGR